MPVIETSTADQFEFKIIDNKTGECTLNLVIPKGGLENLSVAERLARNEAHNKIDRELSLYKIPQALEDSIKAISDKFNKLEDKFISYAAPQLKELRNLLLHEVELSKAMDTFWKCKDTKESHEKYYLIAAQFDTAVALGDQFQKISFNCTPLIPKLKNLLSQWQSEIAKINPVKAPKAVALEMQLYNTTVENMTVYEEMNNFIVSMKADESKFTDEINSKYRLIRIAVGLEQASADAPAGSAEAILAAMHHRSSATQSTSKGDHSPSDNSVIQNSVDSSPSLSGATPSLQSQTMILERLSNTYGNPPGGPAINNNFYDRSTMQVLPESRKAAAAVSNNNPPQPKVSATASSLFTVKLFVPPTDPRSRAAFRALEPVPSKCSCSIM